MLFKNINDFSTGGAKEQFKQNLKAIITIISEYTQLDPNIPQE